jgi:hypothetical protein
MPHERWHDTRRREAGVAKQGCALQENEVRKIINLLASTDMSLLDIAQRTGCSRGAIAAINRRHRIRDYAGRRTSWAVLPETSSIENLRSR